MQLLGNRILLTPKEAIEKTTSGIYIPDQLKQQRNVGTITHIGTDVDSELLGKDILFNLQAARDFNGDGFNGKLIFVTDIIATLN